MKNWKHCTLVGMVAILAVTIVLVACGGGNDGDSGKWGNPPSVLVGTWMTMGVSPVMVINANGTGTMGGDPVDSWKVKGSELKMDYSGVESIVKWSVSGNTLTLSYPSDTSTIGMGNLLIAYSPLTKQEGTVGPGGGGGGDVAMLRLNYDGNGAIGEVPEASFYKYGATVTIVVAPGNLTKAGYSFIGWNTERDGSGTRYYDWGTVTFVITRNITLYAMWAEMAVPNEW
jgi:uncharacterized repeat protein (TIGR02543 family)